MHKRYRKPESGYVREKQKAETAMLIAEELAERESMGLAELLQQVDDIIEPNGPPALAAQGAVVEAGPAAESGPGAEREAMAVAEPGAEREPVAGEAAGEPAVAQASETAGEPAAQRSQAGEPPAGQRSQPPGEPPAAPAAEPSAGKSEPSDRLTFLERFLTMFRKER